MPSFLTVSAADSESEHIFSSLGGHALSGRMGAVEWSGTADQLYERLRPLIPQLQLVTSMEGDCFLGRV